MKLAFHFLNDVSHLLVKFVANVTIEIGAKLVAKLATKIVDS